MNIEILFIHSGEQTKNSEIHNQMITLGFKADAIDCKDLRSDPDVAAMEVCGIDPNIACFVADNEKDFATFGIVSHRLKIRKPEIKIVFMGESVISNPTAMMDRNPNIDFVIQDEGTYTLIELLEAYGRFNELNNNSLSFIRGLGFRLGKKTIMNQPAPALTKEELSE